MGIKKKYAKGRLDKYYHMAKEQGYRARSAFKLIQLNKKFNFLEKSKVLIDLCAAPGGWCQVAAKYMPKPSIIIGIDLAPIPPIPGVMTFVEDITTSKCRSVIKRELKTWKADVVLHDGAPNVGSSWIQDAFFQSELTLSALKLATEFLMEGGTFVTKVFRSKDYNKLMWVFQQLFGRVEATKPSSSRNVSAEIFVVCRDYLAPKKIDPRVLDPSFVFKEIDDVLMEGDERKIKEKQGAVLNDIFHPEKRRRHRDGYAEGDYTLYNDNSVLEFISSPTYLEYLAESSCLTFGKEKESQEILNHATTTDEIKECCKDLKVLGKKEFKSLIKWRELIRLDLGYSKSTKEGAQDEEEGSDDKEQEETPESLAEKLEQESKRLQADLKREKRKQRERKAKTLLKLRLGMETPLDIGVDAANIEHFADQDYDLEHLKAPSRSVKESVEESDSDTQEQDEEQDDESIYDSDQEVLHKVSHLETEMDELYKNYLSRKSNKDVMAKIKKQKEGAAAEFEEWYGVEYDAKKESKTEQDSDSDDSFSDSESDSSSSVSDSNQEFKKRKTEYEPESNHVLSKKAKLFFENPIFKGLQDKKPEKKSKSMFDKDMDSMSIDESDSNDSEKVKSKKKKNKKESKAKVVEKESKEFEIVAAPKQHSDADDDYIIETAQEYSLAQQLIRPSKKRDALDNAYNRYAFNDPDLPDWFAMDENRHNKPSLPVTKEAMQIMKQKAMAMDARPIKKVAEAQWRKQVRSQRRLEKAMKKANNMNEDEDLPEKSKLSAISEMMRKAKGKKTPDEKPKLVVARGSAKGVKGRPKGVKGRYKIVDKRMKKEILAQKRKKNATKSRKRK